MAKRRADHGAGVFSSAFGFTVFLLFLLFTVQLLFGLYVRTTVTAVATDVAHRAAREGTDATRPDRIAHHRADVQRRLGRGGDAAEVDFDLVDADANGRPDTLAVRLRYDLPTFLPTRWLPADATMVERTVRARLETFHETG